MLPLSVSATSASTTVAGKRKPADYVGWVHQKLGDSEKYTFVVAPHCVEKDDSTLLHSLSYRHYRSQAISDFKVLNMSFHNIPYGLISAAREQRQPTELLKKCFIIFLFLLV